MASARVTLEIGLTYNIGNRTWEHGKEQIITNLGEIHQYQSNGHFKVVVIDPVIQPKPRTAIPAPASDAGEVEQSEEQPEVEQPEEQPEAEVEQSEEQPEVEVEQYEAEVVTEPAEPVAPVVIKKTSHLFKKKS